MSVRSIQDPREILDHVKKLEDVKRLRLPSKELLNTLIHFRKWKLGNRDKLCQ